MKRAYSYVRFSTAEQLKGKSLERQTEAARKWCIANDAELDVDLSLHDLGVSAFRGKNADTGALGGFLKAVHAGQVPRGSFLLIESFDRLSREAVYDAQLTLQNVIQAGITVVTLMDGKQYNVGILRADPVAIIQAVVLMMRSHEESQTKSRRVADAWNRKRADLVKGLRDKPFTSLTPGWIELDKHRRPKLIPARVKLVRRIFSSFLAGDSFVAIATALNQDKIPTFKHARWWGHSYIRLVLANRAVLGEFQPHRMDHSNPKRKQRVPVGEPIKGYWPAILDAKTFNAAQKRLAECTRTMAPRSGLKNILAGLGRCPACDARMERVVHKGVIPRLVCGRARAGGDCRFAGPRLAEIEAGLIAGAGTLSEVVPDATDELREEIAALQMQRSTLEARISDMAMVLTDLPSKTVAQRIQNDEAECERLQAEMDRLAGQMQYGSARRVRDAVTRMKAALQWHAHDPTDAAEVNAALRVCFEKVVIDYPRRQLVVHWRHGQVTELPY